MRSGGMAAALEGIDDVSYVYASLGTNVFVAAAESLEYVASRLTPDKERNTNDAVNDPATTESGNQLESILKQAGKLSPTEREIVTVLFRAGKRLVTEEVLVELEKTRGSTASTGNTKAALAGLVRRDVLDNRQNVKPPGYGIFLPG